MKKTLFFLAFVLLTGSLVFSQVWKGKGRVNGYVFDENNNPLEGVKVKLIHAQHQAGFEVFTDAEGKWTASWMRSGAWDVDFELLEYMPYKIKIQVSEFQRNPEVNVNLKKAEGLLLTDELKESLNQGNSLFDEGKFQEAIVVYEKIIEEHPDAYLIYKNIGNSYFKMEKYEKAEEYYSKVLEKKPDSDDIILLIGNCYVNRNENEKALEWYKKIEFEKIDNPTVLYNIGTNFTNLSKYQEALKYYKKAVELKEDFLDAIYQLGLTYLTLQNYEDSISVFENYLKYDSDSGRAIQVNNFIEFLKKQIK